MTRGECRRSGPCRPEAEGRDVSINADHVAKGMTERAVAVRLLLFCGLCLRVCMLAFLSLRKMLPLVSPALSLCFSPPHPAAAATLHPPANALIRCLHQLCKLTRKHTPSPRPLLSPSRPRPSPLVHAPSQPPTPPVRTQYSGDIKVRVGCTGLLFIEASPQHSA